MSVSVNIGLEFSRYPAGRFPADGKYNGQTFRQKFLVEPLRSGAQLDLFLDDAVDYGSSFLEEAFGGLVRVEALDKAVVAKNLILHSTNPFLVAEIKSYVNEA